MNEQNFKGSGAGSKLILAGGGVDSWIHDSVCTVRVVSVDVSFEVYLGTVTHVSSRVGHHNGRRTSRSAASAA